MRGRRGFSLVELAVTLSVMATLSALLVFWFSGNRDPGLDAKAKSSLTTFSLLQDDAMRRGEAPLDAAAIANGDYDRGNATFTDGSSEGPTEVAVSVIEGEIVIASAAAGADCWGVRMDFTPTADSPRNWWYVAVDEPVCNPTVFEGASFPEDGTGQKPSKPTILP
jgi:prepilin-type N-terminal cleavage/methylation domain-containing protein